MRSATVIATALTSVLLGVITSLSAPQTPAVRSVDEKVLREYAGVYQWRKEAFLYLQIWNEFTGKNQLVAFDESGDVRTLYPTDDDRFFTGPGVAVSTAIESRVEFQRDGNGKITSLTWRRDGAVLRTARRVDIEKREDVRFPSGEVQLDRKSVV